MNPHCKRIHKTLTIIEAKKMIFYSNEKIIINNKQRRLHTDNKDITDLLYWKHYNKKLSQNPSYILAKSFYSWNSSFLFDSNRNILGQKWYSHRFHKRNKRIIIEEQYEKYSINDYSHYGWIYKTTSINSSNTYTGSWIYQPRHTLELTSATTTN